MIRRAGRPCAALVLALLLGLLGGAALGALREPPPEVRAQGLRWVDDEPGCGGREPCHSRIQDAVDAALPGEEIHVLPGRYAESVRVVDRSVALLGPGAEIGDAVQGPGADDSERHALWRAGPGADPGPALTIEAARGDLSGTLVSGFRFYSATVALSLLGRRPDDPLGRPPGRPPAIGAFDIVSPVVRGNLFRDIGLDGPDQPGGQARGALIGRWVRGLQAVDNSFVGGADALVLAGVEGRVEGGRWLAVDGAALRVRQGGGPLHVSGGLVREAGDRGIVLRPLGVPGFSSAGAVHLRDSSVLGAGDAGIHLEGLRGPVSLAGLSVSGGEGAGVRWVDLADARLLSSTLRDNRIGLEIVEGPAAPVSASLVVGGALADGNVLAGNREVAVQLRAVGGQVEEAAHDVDARYNDWGATDAPAIEALIVDREDDPSLGRVSWRPPRDAPAIVLVDVAPAALPADGASTAAVTATLRDPLGRPAPDGTMVHFELAGGGRLRDGGARAEAEDSTVRRVGEWGRFDGAAFGPASGGAWLRSDVVGARLSWPFTATAALVRLGRGPGELGRVALWVDDGPTQTLSTASADVGWREHVVARDLSRGPHLLHLQLLEGRVAVDLVAAGVESASGVATAELVADARVGQSRVVAEAWGAEGPVGGAAEVVFVPGPPFSVTLRAAEPSLSVGGARTRIDLNVRDAAGRSVRDGTPLVLTTTLGFLTPTRLATRVGRATAELRSGTRVGRAVIRARAGEEGRSAEGTLSVPIVPGPPSTLRLTARPERLAANSREEARLTARVEDAWGHPVADGTAVTFASTLGTLSVAEGATLDGEATTRLRAGAVAGPARVTALVDGIDPATATTVTLLAPDLWLRKTVEPETVVVPGELVTFTLRYENRGPGAVYGLSLEDPLPRGLISPTLSTVGPSLVARPGPPFAFTIARLGAGESGVVRVRARVDTSLRWGSRNPVTATARLSSPSAAEATPADNVARAGIVIVPAAVYTVTLSAPAEMGVGGEEAVVLIRVFDRFGNPASDGTPVALSAEGGEIAPGLLTTRGGRAEATFTSGKIAGEAVIRALSLEERGDVARIALRAGSLLTMSLRSGRASLPVGGQRAVLTATLADRFGNPVPEAAVEFVTDLGLVSPAEGRTGPSGWMTTSLRSGVRAGRAHVLARSGPLSEVADLSFLAGPPRRLGLRLDRPRAIVGVPARAMARLADDFDNPIRGLPVTFGATGGVVLGAAAVTSASGEASTRVRFDSLGEAVLRAEAAGIDRQIRVRVEPPRAHLPWMRR